MAQPLIQKLLLLLLLLLLLKPCCQIDSGHISIIQQDERSDYDKYRLWINQPSTVENLQAPPTQHSVPPSTDALRYRTDNIGATTVANYQGEEQSQVTTPHLSHVSESGDLYFEGETSEHSMPPTDPLSVQSHDSHHIDFDDDSDVGDYSKHHLPHCPDELEERYQGMLSAERRGLFHCPPCNCSYTHKGFPIAHCQHQSLFDIPPSLPKDLYRLYLNRTALEKLDIVQLWRYVHLRELYINNNRYLHKIFNSTAEQTNTTLVLIDLSSNYIDHIEDGSFTSWLQLQNLSLKNNKLHCVTNMTFAGLRLLKFLDLAINRIAYIEFGAFDDLKNLEVLDLSSNHPLGYGPKKLLPRLFEPLKRLRQLYLQGSSQGTESVYPQSSLQQLSNLQKLVTDGINENFGPQMKHLTRLTQLQLGSKSRNRNCRFNTLPSTFFDNLPHITTLTLKNCPLSQINSTAYYKAPYLKNLTISHMANYDLLKAFDDLRGLQNSSLKSLAFVHLKHLLPCQFLFKKQTKYLKNIKLENLDLSDNSLALLGNDFIEELPPTLTTLILKRNRFIVVNNILSIHKYLVCLDLSEQRAYQSPFQSMNTVSCTQDMKCKEQNMLAERDVACGLDGHLTFSVNNSEISETDAHTDLIQHMHFSQPRRRKPFAPNLRYLKASHFYQFGRPFFSRLHMEPKKLLSIDISNNALIHLNSRARIAGNVTTADLSGNYFTEIPTHFFKSNNSLVHLNLRNNALGMQFADDENGTVFRHLKNLRYLDMAFNSIFRLPCQVFKGLTSLESLTMTDNKLQFLKINFCHMPSLKFVDLSKNSITWITPESRHCLDVIAASHEIKVDLTLNPLPCTCGGLYIIHWMATTKVTFLNQDFLMCRHENGDIDYIANLQHRLHSLQRYCVSRWNILVTGIACTTVFLFLVGFTTMYRCRWKLRYLKNITLAKLVGYRPRAASALKVKYDAYILYSEDSRLFALRYCRQELEGKRGHKLCLAERDFMPGTIEASAVISAIQYSNKTVAIITPNFYEEELSEYAIKMAIHEEAFRKRSILHLCIYRPMPNEQTEEYHDLLMVMKRNHYTEFPPENQTSEQVRQNFWDQLSQVIGHSAEEVILEGHNQ